MDPDFSLTSRNRCFSGALFQELIDFGIKNPDHPKNWSGEGTHETVEIVKHQSEKNASSSLSFV
jgi:hypothetical protein